MMPESYFANLPGGGREIFDTLSEEDKDYIRKNLNTDEQNVWVNANMKKVLKYISMTPSERLRKEAKIGREETLRVKHTALLVLQLVDRFVLVWRDLNTLGDPLHMPSYRKLRGQFLDTLLHVRTYKFRSSWKEESLDDIQL
jgi:hypothetical protein